MKKGLNLKSIKNILQKYTKHAVLGAVLIVLAIYIFVVFKISSLSKAEPTPDQVSSNATLIPRVNQKAVDQIQSLENSNTDIHSLFEHARNNPFQE
jgi:hypothetical protein